MAFSKLKKILTTDFGQISVERQRQKEKEEHQKKLDEIYFKARTASKQNATRRFEHLEGIHVVQPHCSAIERNHKLMLIVLHAWLDKKDFPKLLHDITLGEVNGIGQVSNDILDELQLLKDIAVEDFGVEDPHSPLNTVQLSTKRFRDVWGDVTDRRG